AITEFDVPTPYSDPISITAGSDGNLWFSESQGPKIGRITPAGVITEFDVSGTHPLGITNGPDGNLWFGGDKAIGRITPDGTVTLFPLPAGHSSAVGITTGPDGNLWFTENGPVPNSLTAT